jgi:hypothetical protein
VDEERQRHPLQVIEECLPQVLDDAGSDERADVAAEQE